MADIERWSGVDNDNTLTVPDGAPEGWDGQDVNEWGREAMASVRRMWELDELRNLVVLTGGGKAGVVRNSDTQLTIQNIDRTTALPAGRRIRVDNGVAATKWCTVVTAVLSGSDTVVTVEPDPDSDGTGTALGTGQVTFTTGPDHLVDDGSGTDSTPFTEVEVGDRIRITAGSRNLGIWRVTGVNVNERELDLEPVPGASYALVADGPTAITVTWIDDVGTLPAASLVDVYIPGSHTDAQAPATGVDPLTVPYSEILGSAAYEQRRQMVIRELAEGSDEFVADDANRLVRVKVPGGGLPETFELGPKLDSPAGAGDAGKIIQVNTAGDGFEVRAGTPIARAMRQWSGGDTSLFAVGLAPVVLINMFLPGPAPNGTTRAWRIRCGIHVNEVAPQNMTYSLHVGPNGNAGDPVVYALSIGVGSTGGVRLFRMPSLERSGTSLSAFDVSTPAPVNPSEAGYHNFPYGVLLIPAVGEDTLTLTWTPSIGGAGVSLKDDTYLEAEFSADISFTP